MLKTFSNNGKHIATTTIFVDVSVADARAEFPLSRHKSDISCDKTTIINVLIIKDMYGDMLDMSWVNPWILSFIFTTLEIVMPIINSIPDVEIIIEKPGCLFFSKSEHINVKNTIPIIFIITNQIFL